MTTDYIEDLKKTLNEKTDHCGRKHLKVTFRDYIKNNNIVRHACTVSLRNYKEIYAAPTLYLEDFYEYYLMGIPLTSLADKILDCAEEYLRSPALPSVDLSNYDSVRTHLCIQLVNCEKNAELLRRLLWRPLEDLAIIPVLLIEDPEMGRGCIKVRKEYIESWGVTDARVFDDAISNAPDILPATFCSLEDMLAELCRSTAAGGTPNVPGDEFYSGSVLDFNADSETNSEKDTCEMYLLSNSRLTSGAASIVYPGVAQKVHRRIGSDYFLLPSSVNEWIIVRDFGQSPAEFKQIVQDVNHSEVPPEEVLSDSVYQYRKGYKSISRVC